MNGSAEKKGPTEASANTPVPALTPCHDNEAFLLRA